MHHNQNFRYNFLKLFEQQRRRLRLHFARGLRYFARLYRPPDQLRALRPCRALGYDARRGRYTNAQVQKKENGRIYPCRLMEILSPPQLPRRNPRVVVYWTCGSHRLARSLLAALRSGSKHPALPVRQYSNGGQTPIPKGRLG